MTGSRRLQFAVFTLVAALGLALVGLELGLRLFWSGFYVKGGSYAAPHELRGWVNQPGIRIDYGEPEFKIVIEHNSRGYRSPEISTQKPAGVFRVLALGDSMTWGVGVEQDETFSAQLGARDSRFEVINTGVNGYGTSQQLLLLRDEGLALQPDLVLVAFFWNDVGDSYTRPFPAFGLADGELVYPEPRTEEEMVQVREDLDRRRLMTGPLRYSYAYRSLSDGIKILRYWWKDLMVVQIEEADVPAEDREAAWELELALLEEIDRLAGESGAQTLIVAIPDQVQVQPEWRVIGLEPEEYEIQQRLHAFSKRSGIRFLDLLPVLREAYERDGAPLYYRRDRHLVASGHRIVADAIYAEIVRLGLLED